MRVRNTRSLLCLALVLAGCGSSSAEDAAPVPVEDASADSASPDATGGDALPDGASVDGSPETALVDSALVDSAIVDSASTDAASTDAASTDAASTDAASTDAASTDAASTDAASTDAASTDAASTDAGSADSGSDAVATDAASDTRDGSADGGANATLPGAACTGELTDPGLVDLYANKTQATIPYILGGNTQARLLGTYESTLYKRSCNSNTGCGAWAEALQPAYESFWSINDTVRRGKLYLRSASGVNKLVIVSDTVGTDCKGWTEGQGDIVRNGTSATATLATKVEDNCAGGADPVFLFEQKDLYDPTGIVTDHCMKLTYSKERNRVDIGPGAYTYDEYLVVYAATY